MLIKRSWATPLIAGAFLLSAVTGILIFFHLDRGLNKPAHEWLGWALVAGGLFHVIANFAAFKQHLRGRMGQGLIGVFALILLLSGFIGGEGEKPRFASAVQALAQAPLPLLAQVAQISPDEVERRLQAAGLNHQPEQQNLQAIVGTGLRQQIAALNAVLAPEQKDDDD